MFPPTNARSLGCSIIYMDPCVMGHLPYFLGMNSIYQLKVGWWEAFLVPDVLIQGQFTNKKKGNDSYNVICHSEPSPSHRVSRNLSSVGLGFCCTWMFRRDCADNPQKRITPGLCGSMMIYDYDAMSIVWSSGDPFFTTDEIDGIWTHVPDVFFWRFGLMKNHGCHCLTMERWYLPAVCHQPMSQREDVMLVNPSHTPAPQDYYIDLRWYWWDLVGIPWYTGFGWWSITSKFGWVVLALGLPHDYMIQTHFASWEFWCDDGWLTSENLHPRNHNRSLLLFIIDMSP